MTGPWIVLLVAGLLEVGWAIGLKYTDGFSFVRRPLASSLTLAGMVASMYMLSLAVRSIPIGTGYAVWTGIGALGAATLGMVLFHEPVTVWRILFLLMLVTGIVGLKLTAPAEAAAAPATGPAQERFTMYIGTYGKGIYRAIFDPSTGAFVGEAQLAAGMKNASFLARHPTLPVLYAVSEVGDFEGGVKTGGVIAFKIGEGGGLTRLNAQPSHGDGPCYVSVSVDGRALLVANYGGATVASYPIDQATGAIRTFAAVDQHEGSSVDPKRQTRAFAHSLVPTPDGKYAISADLGMDALLIYRIDENGAIERVRETKLPPGSGPRHVAFSTDGSTCYVINEIGNKISVFAWADGTLTPRQVVRTLSEGFTDYSVCAEVAVHPSGHFVYASNRGHDSIAIFAVGADHDLVPAGHTSSGGKEPRHFAIDPSGRFLVAANQKSNELVLFRLDTASGKLTEAS